MSWQLLTITCPCDYALWNFRSSLRMSRWYSGRWDEPYKLVKKKEPFFLSLRLYREEEEEIPPSLLSWPRPKKRKEGGDKWWWGKKGKALMTSHGRKGPSRNKKQKEEKVFPHTHKNSMRETKVLRVSPRFYFSFFFSLIPGDRCLAFLLLWRPRPLASLVGRLRIHLRAHHHRVLHARAGVQDRCGLENKWSLANWRKM